MDSISRTVHFDPQSIAPAIPPPDSTSIIPAFSAAAHHLSESAFQKAKSLINSELLKEKPIFSGYLKKKNSNKLKVLIFLFYFSYACLYLFLLNRNGKLTGVFCVLMLYPLTQKKTFFFCVDSPENLNLWVGYLRNARNISLRSSCYSKKDNPLDTNSAFSKNINITSATHQISAPTPFVSSPPADHKYHSDSHRNSNITIPASNSGIICPPGPKIKHKDYSSSMHDLYDYFSHRPNLNSDSLNFSCSENSSDIDSSESFKDSSPDNLNNESSSATPQKNPPANSDIPQTSALETNDTTKSSLNVKDNTPPMIADIPVDSLQFSSLETIQKQMAIDKVIKSGYLYKQGRLKAWNRRWFVLRPSGLSYYPDNKEYKITQIFQKSAIFDARLPDPSSNKANSSKRVCFRLVTLKRSYWLAHDSSDTISEWVTVLKDFISSPHH
ncbi:Sterol 3-beta-glucosyltransferase [Smittium mucronatum]|uniref:Sterol 3-beta-glucosyltransferase n=1 Tax=Smittium mucronatum TaxID=133383 RepID=A0A1R0GUV5_9FUNG|nr:Sterol 3-beta-glucosyltransferase [Smittium mucronatum]